MSASGTVYLRAQDATGCWSDAVEVNVTVNPKPDVPEMPTLSTNSCGSKTLTIDVPGVASSCTGKQAQPEQPWMMTGKL